MLEQEPAVDEVVRGVAAPRVDGAEPELGVFQTALCRDAAREIELELIHVEPRDVTVRGHQPCQLETDGTTAAAQVEAMHPRRNAHASEQLGSVWPALPSENLQPVVAHPTAADHASPHTIDRIRVASTIPPRKGTR